MVVVAVPLIWNLRMPPARMKAADEMFALLDSVEFKEGDIAFLALDFGPNTKAENEPQAETVIEHLFRRRIPFMLYTQYALGEGFLTSIPERVIERLKREDPTNSFTYGRDWVNIGYRPGASLFLQGLSKASSVRDYLGQDRDGTDLKQFPIFRGTGDLRSIKLLYEFTGLVGAFNGYIQFFQKDGYVPVFGHGCTSITIPEAYIYLDSGQLSGLLEGVAGAAWYSKLLTDAYPHREQDSSLVLMTSLGVAHLAIICMILLGNMLDWWAIRRERRAVS